MNNLDKCQNQILEQKLVDFGVQPDSGTPPISSLIRDIIRRWYIVLSIFLVMCFIGIPAVWFLRKPVYGVTGAIRVAPILTNVLSGETDKGEISNYESFTSTQAVMITSSQVVQRVADDLTNKNLEFFKDGAAGPVKKLKQTLKGTTTASEPLVILKQAIAEGVITAAADRRSELIRVTMNSENPDEAKQIVDAFVRNYMAVEVSSFAEAENQKLNLLENERQVYFQKIQEQRKTISQLALEYGAKDLKDRRDMKLERVAKLLAQVTEYEARRIHLEATVELLEKTNEEQTIGPEELLQMRNGYINTDPVITAFATNITQLEQDLIVARQRLTGANPELKDKVQLVESLKARVAQLKEEAGEAFDKLIAEKTAKAGKEKLIKARTELEQVRTYEQRFRDLLAKEDTETIGVGRTQVTIQDLEDELALTKETYNNIDRRIKELEMEQKRPARISIAYNADVASINDKRVKLTLALIFGAMACGVSTAFLLAKVDQRLQTPDDVAKSIDIRILGTTADFRHIKKALLPKQLAEDYQIICENLRLLGNNGEEMPKKLIVTSPGPR
jgi:uncharacterized protein involved in exopolysaccharide biosynthesis